MSCQRICRSPPQTIRHDLNQLYKLALVQRVHGGAVIKDSVGNLGYGARKIPMAAEKAEIARLTVKIIPDKFIELCRKNEVQMIIANTGKR